VNINVNHPSFVLFLDNITNNILSNVTLESYFSLPQDKKRGSQYVVFKIIKNVLSTNTKLTDTEFKEFLTILWKKNEENENYELASLLKDIITHFDAMKDISKISKKQTKTNKTEKEQ